MYDLIERAVMWMHALPPFPVWLLLGIVLGLATTLIHELGLHSDGQKLLDLTRLVVGGRVAAWIVLSTGAEDPHTATSVPPPG